MDLEKMISDLRILKKDVSELADLRKKILIIEEQRTKARERWRLVSHAFMMHKEGFVLADIASYTGLSRERVRQLIAKETERWRQVKLEMAETDLLNKKNKHG